MTTESLYPRMVQEYYVARLREMARRRTEQRAKLRTRAQVLRLRRDVRRKLRACFGPAPERTPLNAVTTGVVRANAYSVEKVVYHSRPGFKVTANLYVPRGDGPFPVVLGPCGHSANGKAAVLYQAFAGGLQLGTKLLPGHTPPRFGRDRHGKFKLRLCQMKWLIGKHKQGT